MNTRDIIKLAAKLYIDDYLKKKTTILANAEKGKDINIDIFMPKVTEVTISDFAKYLLPKTKIIRLKGQKLAKLNERIHQRDQHKCIYCGNRVDPGKKFHHEHNGIKSDQIEYGVLLCMDCHTERHHGKKCNDVKEYCRKYLINLYGESIYSK